MILTRGELPRLRDAAAALLASTRPPDALVLVDNGADVADALRAALPAALVRATGRNLGFAGGANLGIAAALESGAEAVLLLNDDARLAPEALELLAHALEAPGVGVVGPALLDAGEGPGERVESIGLAFSRRSGRLRELERGRPWRAAASREVPAVSGCVMLLRRELLCAVGAFDAGFFFSGEDLDLCLRARAAGWRVMAVPAARAWHARGATLGRRAPARLYHALRGQLRLGHKLGGPGRRARQVAIAGWGLLHALRRGHRYEPGALGAALEAALAHALDWPWGGASGRGS